jgi:hypothetical protein
MSQIVVDTDVASYIFNWHSSAQPYIDALRTAFDHDNTACLRFRTNC